MPVNAMAMAQRIAIFVPAYLGNGHNARDAALEAGYAESTARKRGFELLKRPDVRKLIAEHQARISEKAEITVADVIDGLYDEAIYRGDGSSHAARVSAWTAIGKHLGAFAKKTDDEDRKDVVDRYAQAKARAEAAASGKVVDIEHRRRA